MFTHYKEPEKSATTAMRSLLLMPGEVILLPTRCIDGLRSEASVSKRKDFWFWWTWAKMMLEC